MNTLAIIALIYAGLDIIVSIAYYIILRVHGWRPFTIARVFRDTITKNYRDVVVNAYAWDYEDEDDEDEGDGNDDDEDW